MSGILYLRNTVVYLRKSVARWWIFIAAFLLGLIAQEVIFAQNYGMKDSLPPGIATQRALMSHPEWRGYAQPVQLSAPGDTEISSWAGGGFTSEGIGDAKFGLNVGTVYRLKISNMPNRGVQELFPSIELLSRLHPPAGQETEFPVPVMITEDDIEQALGGNMVTKVIYLEDPETALAYEQQEGTMLNLDIPATEDALSTASSLGRPMAILRIGSRQPTPQELNGEFAFYSPSVQPLARPAIDFPDSADMQVVPEQIPEINSPDPQTKRRSVPIIDGATKASYTLGDKSFTLGDK